MISAIVLTKNESELIKPCLESLFWVDELIVVDDNSTDTTLDICQQYTDKIFVHTLTTFADQRDFAIENAQGEWVLYVDADERVTEKLHNEIVQTIGKFSTDAAYAIPRRNFWLGEEQRYVGGWPDYVVRLIKKDMFEGWQGKLHEHPTIKGSIGKLAQPFIHLTHRDITSMTKKTMDWSMKEAELRLEANHPQMTSWRFFRVMLTSFFDWYIKKGGYKGGTVGTIESLFQTFSMFFSYVRLWEMQQQPALKETYKKIDEELVSSGFTKP